MYKFIFNYIFRIFLAAGVLLYSCQSQQLNSQEYCVKFEHFGISNHMMYTTLVFSGDVVCEIKEFKSPIDSMIVDQVKVTSMIHKELTNYVLEYEPKVDFKAVAKDSTCSFFVVFILQGDSVIKEFPVLNETEYDYFFPPLYDKLTFHEDTDGLFRAMKNNMKRDYFECMSRSAY